MYILPYPPLMSCMMTLAGLNGTSPDTAEASQFRIACTSASVTAAPSQFRIALSSKTLMAKGNALIFSSSPSPPRE